VCQVWGGVVGVVGTVAVRRGEQESRRWRMRATRYGVGAACGARGMWQGAAAGGARRRECGRQASAKM